MYDDVPFWSITKNQRYEVYDNFPFYFVDFFQLFRKLKNFEKLSQ